MSQASFKAGGNILPSSIVKISGTNTVSQADNSTNVPLIGISQEFLNGAPVAGSGEPTLAAISGQEVMVYQPGDQSICMLQSTSAGWTANDLLGPNASGLGITLAVGSGDQYVARALTTVSGSTLGKVVVLVGIA